MTNLICILAFKLIIESSKVPTTIWHCDGIGFVSPLNSKDFFELSKDEQYNIVADKKRNFFYSATKRPH